MSLNFNRVIISGRVVKDIELKKTQSGLNVASFAIAVNKPGNSDDANFFNCTAWKERADFVAKYFHKGDPIFVEGYLNQNHWTASDGSSRSSVDIVANAIDFVESKNAQKPSGGTENIGNIPGVFNEPPKQKQPVYTKPADDDEELPF